MRYPGAPRGDTALPPMPETTSTATPVGPADPEPDRSSREDTVIGALIRATRAPPSPAGPGDDGAVLADGTVVTVDTLVDGVHWDARLSMADVGYKSVAVSVSDLVAMGARPGWMVLALTLPDPAAAAAFTEGFAEAAHRFGVTLVGGDTTQGPTATVTVTMAGRCVAAPLLRSGARAGDTVWATGTPGLAGAGWRLAAPPPDALAALRRPEPPLAFGLALAAAGYATAGMDLSDGLGADLHRLCAASRVGVEVDGDALTAGLRPRLGDALADEALACAIGGGDDYQLLFTAPPGHDAAVRDLAAAHGVRVTAIGQITPSSLWVRVGADRRPLGGPAFAHWGAA